MVLRSKAKAIISIIYARKRDLLYSTADIKVLLK